MGTAFSSPLSVAGDGGDNAREDEEGAGTANCTVHGNHKPQEKNDLLPQEDGDGLMAPNDRELEGVRQQQESGFNSQQKRQKMPSMISSSSSNKRNRTSNDKEATTMVTATTTATRKMTGAGGQQHLTPSSITAELLKPTDYLVGLDPITVVQADITAAETGMQSLLRSLQGADRNAFRQVFREYNPFNVSLINAVTYFWGLQANNKNLKTKLFSEHVVAILDVLFHRNNPRVKLQAMVFVRAIMLTRRRFQPLPPKTNGINTPFCVILVKLLEWFDPLGPPIIQERIDGRDVPFRERDLFTGLKDSIIDVMKKLTEGGRFWLNTQNEFNAILMGKYREYWNGMKTTTPGTESSGLWTNAFHAIEDIQAATKGHSGRY